MLGDDDSLTWDEYTRWKRIEASELRGDAVAIRARHALAVTLDRAKESGWCDCDGHTSALLILLGVVWRDPPE